MNCRASFVRFDMSGMRVGDRFLGCPRCGFRLPVGQACKPECPDCREPLQDFRVERGDVLSVELDASVVGQCARQHRKLKQARAAMRRLVYSRKKVPRLFRWSHAYARAQEKMRGLSVVLNRRARFGGAS